MASETWAWEVVDMRELKSERIGFGEGIVGQILVDRQKEVALIDDEMI